MKEIKVPRSYLNILNQVFELERKALALGEQNTISRNIKKLKQILEEELEIGQGAGHAGFVYHDPLGEAYDETRTDCEASIAGTSTENLRIIDVIKPIIRLRQGGATVIVQKAVVVVQSEDDVSNSKEDQNHKTK